MAKDRRLDVVVFGATGFTGALAVVEVEKLALEKNLTWGIAGRNETKLTDVLAKVSKATGKDLSKKKIIVADVTDDGSLLAMAQQSSVIINCCGPYHLYGEPVVRACITAKTSCVDISGEPQYIEKIRLKYNEEAERNGVYIISACGAVDSIPVDVGAVYIQNKFPGDINSIEAYVKTSIEGSHKGAAVHFGTYESAVHAVASMSITETLRKMLQTSSPTLQPTLRLGAFFWHRISGGWCFPIPGPDLEMMRQTQRHFYEFRNKRPAQTAFYISFSSLLRAFYFMFIFGIIAIFSKFQCGRHLLLKHPRFFSGGYVSHEGPSEERMKSTHFEVYLVGRGWKEKNEEHSAERKTRPDQTITVKVSCTDPGYGATCTTVVLSALTILKESHKMPKSGGVLTPGVAFENTSLVNELNNHGVKFEILSQS